MARSIEEIQNAIKVEIRTHPSLDKFLFPEDGGSQVGVFNLLIYVVSLSIYTFEILLDGFQQDVEEASLKVPAGNPQWVRQQMLFFQFGDVIQLSEDFVPFYPVVDESKRIVAQCSVTEEFSSEIKIKVAKDGGAGLIPLTPTELSALEDYYFGTSTSQGVGFAGVRGDFISVASDKMNITGEVFYLGQFVEATVKAEVIAAIKNYYATMGETSFNGIVDMNKVVEAATAVAGVDRYQINAVEGREDIVAAGAGTVVPVNGTYETIAGYIESDETPLFTLEETTTMTRA